MGLSALREIIPKPITMHILNLFYHLLNVKYFGNKDYLMVWAAMALAFFGFLRIGELTAILTSILKVTFSFSDQLKVSKTDPFRKGQTKVTGKANSHLCRLPAMLAYLESCTLFPTTGP